ncbi:hypothetical protein HMI46_21805 [Paenibacillus alvei]|uniref:Uncharacterized protein n=2 Tax=Paenibacillus alvei TaxID=44250 RepID=A0AAP7A4H1_PAEAL|nr:hypothetical protein [Paenibacillus alvei]
MEGRVRTEHRKIVELERRLATAERKTEQAAEARRKLGIGASRARVTSANARWKAAAEERDRLMEELKQMGESVEQ